MAPPTPDLIGLCNAMEYLTVNFVPRPDGSWYATVSRRSTRAVRGMPRTLGSSRPILIDGARGQTVEEIVSTVLRSLGGIPG